MMESLQCKLNLENINFVNPILVLFSCPIKEFKKNPKLHYYEDKLAILDSSSFILKDNCIYVQIVILGSITVEVGLLRHM